LRRRRARARAPGGCRIAGAFRAPFWFTEELQIAASEGAAAARPKRLLLA